VVCTMCRGEIGLSRKCVRSVTCPAELFGLSAVGEELDRESLIHEFISMNMRPDADAFGDSVDTPVKYVAGDYECLFPHCDFKLQGVSDLSAWFVKLFRSIPDMSVTVHEVTMGSDTADVIFTWSGTQVVPSVVPMFPLGKFVEMTVKSSLTFNEAGLISKEFMTLDMRAGPSPQVCDGIAEWAWALASTRPGSDLLQEVIESAGRVDVLEQLKGNIPAAACCNYGNHVLQKYIVAMPPAASQFIVDGLRGRVVGSALHHAACRVLQRLLEHCPCQQVEPLVQELLADMQDLLTHRFGNFVIQCLLEHGAPHARRRVVDVICGGDAKSLARHWIAHNIVRCAFVHCAPEDRARLAHAIAPDSTELAKLVKHRHGSFLARDIKIALRSKCH